MKICIPFEPENIGGTSIFMLKFVKVLNDRGVEVTTNIEDNYDLILVIADLNRSFEEKAREKKKAGVKVIQRLDGVMTFATSKFLYPIQNAGMKHILHNVADHIIYQSEYSKELCDRFLGKTKCDWSIIYNGVDLKKFNPDGEKSVSNYRSTLISVGRFSRKVTLYPLIKAMEYINLERPEVELILIGPLDSNLLKMIHNIKQINYRGPVPNERIPFYERGADVFMFPLRSANPNVLLESIACGLPVACYDIGSNREILGNNIAGILADSGFEKNIYQYYMMMPDPEKLAKAALTIMDDPHTYKKAARERAEKLFSIDRMVDEYIQVFSKTLNKS